MKVLVYGGGAVGLGLASCLLKGKSQVGVIARPDTVNFLKKDGLNRTGIFGNFFALPQAFSAFESLDEITNGDFDFILVCIKSFDSASAAQDLSNHKEIFAKNTKIVLCQNGWGNAEKFLPHFSKEQVYSARIITGFTRHKSNEVEITVHADAIHVGSLFGCDLSFMQPLAKAISDGGIECITVPDIEKDLWAKMLYNCALNPLGAILDVPYGSLAKNEWSRDLMNHIVEEIFIVMTKAGFKTHWNTAGGFQKKFYDKLVPDTAQHKSSTLRDIEAGKKTEIEALTGEVLALAQKYNTSTPYNQTVYNIIKFIEKINPY